ncbi:hypothetical protein BD626DRAFT_138176 [Schizophyllum amplum]|uniref:G-protein coupled receptors family 1 profile domain-containing protein n=1 Tax=Schizophyllum amplum TaxID=97359 RepID=A0A550C640_9AGAR|nr:hypothetical protein BD626DRAFT_138176 [Auriculariopsis ampla]
MSSFSSDEVVGLVFITAGAFVSVTAVAFLLLYVLYLGIRRQWSISTLIHYYFVNLMFAELIQALGGVMTVEWIVKRSVDEGGLCTMQGAFKQLGDVSVALTSIAIAIHTFSAIVFKIITPHTLAVAIMGFIWFFSVLVVAIPAGLNYGRYYGNTGYWCWIQEDFDHLRIPLEYMYMWAAAFISIICYACVAVVLRGHDLGMAKIANGHRFSMSTMDRGSQRKAKNLAMQMLFYPVIYFVTVFPIAVVRWMAFSGYDIPFEATAFADTLFSLSGLFNVLLYAWTRRSIITGNKMTTVSGSRSGSTSYHMHPTSLTTDMRSPTTVHFKDMAYEGDMATPAVPADILDSREAMQVKVTVVSYPDHYWGDNPSMKQAEIDSKWPQESQ